MVQEDFNQMDEILQTIIKDADKHGRWLNTLSFLEYIGTRKMLATQDVAKMDEELLRHIAEEARHASFFKNLIVKTSVTLPDYSSSNLFCGFSAYRYFQGLDIITQKELFDIDEDREYFFTCYLYVSHLIEERANWLYQKYNSILQHNNSAFTLNAVINEEEKHLEQMKKYLLQTDSEYPERIARLRSQEVSLFDRLYLNLMRISGV